MDARSSPFFQIRARSAFLFNSMETENVLFLKYSSTIFPFIYQNFHLRQQNTQYCFCFSKNLTHFLLQPLHEQPSGEESVNIVLKRVSEKFDEQKETRDFGVVEWTPPTMNWNPWINQPTVIEGAEEYQVRSGKSAIYPRRFCPPPAINTSGYSHKYITHNFACLRTSHGVHTCKCIVSSDFDFKISKNN